MKFLDILGQKVKKEDYDLVVYENDDCEFGIEYEGIGQNKYSVYFELCRDDMGDNLSISVVEYTNDDSIEDNIKQTYSMFFPFLKNPLTDNTVIYKDVENGIYEERWLFNPDNNTVDKTDLDIIKYDFIKWFLEECENNTKELMVVFELILKDFDKYLEYLDWDDEGRKLFIELQ